MFMTFSETDVPMHEGRERMPASIRIRSVSKATIRRICTAGTEYKEKHDVGRLAVAEVFGIRVAVAERIGDEHGGLASQLKTLAALKTRDQVVETHHVRTGLSKALLILLVR